VLPLAVALWAFAGWDSGKQQAKTDERLHGWLQTAVADYGRILGNAEGRAAELGSSPRIQSALARRDRRRLARLADRTLSFRLGRSADSATPGAVSRSVEVVARGRTLGRVIVSVPLDAGLLERLERASRLPDGARLMFAGGDTLTSRPAGSGAQARLLPVDRAVDLTTGGERYRALATFLGSGSQGRKLVALAPTAAISTNANADRWRVIVVGFGVLVAVLLVGYALAPVIARNRLAKHQRTQAARVLSHVGDGVFLIDSEGVIRLWNTAAEAITGLAAANVYGRPAQAAISGWRKVEPLVRVASRPGDPREISGAETVPLDIEGRELWLSIAGVAFTDGTVYTFRDVTDERRLESIRSEFVATVSHELRTPLASLHGAAMTLRQRHERFDADTRDQLLDMIAGQSNRLAALVEEILLTSQLDARSLRIATEPFDPEQLLQTAVQEARLRLSDGTTVEVSSTTALPYVVGDGVRAHQVLGNLIDNAIKYSPAGARVQVTAEQAGESIRFSVRDDGFGIPSGEQNRIFDKFYRLDPDHLRGVGGSGLGLYICRELVRSMSGRIWVESEPGRGATFSFELPIAEPLVAGVELRPASLLRGS
jgi:two-component system, OmpR family, phosphate regulon sensor histidine kinase PhoR